MATHKAIKKINQRISVRLDKIVEQDKIDIRNLELLLKLYDLREKVAADGVKTK